MAVQAKNYLDFTGLSTYDQKIKSLISTEDAKAIKTVLWDETSEQIKFYKKENATLSDTADYSVSVASSDVEALKTRVGLSDTLNSYNSASNLTTILNVLTGDSSTTGSVAKALGDAEDYADAKVAALDANEFALASVSNNVVTIKGIKEDDGVIAIGTDTSKDVVFEEVAVTGAAADVSYSNSTSGMTATTVQAAIDEIDTTLDALGTAANADIATSAIQEESSDDGLVSAAQVATFVAAEIADLEGAMHFRAIVTRESGETDAQAIARVVTDPAAGDVVVMSDNAKEYIYDGIAWREVGDEGLYVQKSTTIAGVNLEDNITKSELLTALNVADGAQVNVLEGVQVNSSDLTIDANKKVNVTVAEGSTNGTVAVNGSDIAVHGLGSAAYTASSAYDAAGTAAAAVAALDTSSDVAIASYDSTNDVITLTGSVSETDGIVEAGSADTITLTTITTAEINALFS